MRPVLVYRCTCDYCGMVEYIDDGLSASNWTRIDITVSRIKLGYADLPAPDNTYYACYQCAKRCATNLTPPANVKADYLGASHTIRNREGGDK